MAGCRLGSVSPLSQTDSSRRELGAVEVSPRPRGPHSPPTGNIQHVPFQRQHLGRAQLQAKGVPLLCPSLQTPLYPLRAQSAAGRPVLRARHSPRRASLFAALEEDARPCHGPSLTEPCLCPRLPSSCSWFKPPPAPANNALSRSDRIMASHWFHMSQIIALPAHHIEVVRTLLRL